jgi:hypothetical protein
MKKKGFLANQAPTEEERRQIETAMNGISHTRTSEIVLGDFEVGRIHGALTVLAEQREREEAQPPEPPSNVRDIRFTI